MAYQWKTLAEGSLMKSAIIKTLFEGGKTLNKGELGQKIFKKLNYKTLHLIRRSFK